jgi:5'-deoxynucleotidase YfbR-like HD superfamily hydrolase
MPPDGRASPRAWQRMLSGRRLDLIDPSPLDVEIDDISHGLARVARWNGQTIGDHAFSVAQHCLFVEQIALARKPGAPPRDKLATLLHDGPEYVIGDMISPFKALVGGDYRPVEERLLAAIHLRFGLPATLPKVLTVSIKKADRIAAYWEAVHLAGFDEPEAAKYFRRPHRPLADELKTLLNPWPAKKAETAYMKRFKALAKAFSG